VGSTELMRGRTDNELEAQIQGLFTWQRAQHGARIITQRYMYTCIYVWDLSIHETQIKREIISHTYISIYMYILLCFVAKLRYCDKTSNRW